MMGRKWGTEEERRAAVRESQRRYREKHRERVRASQRAYIECHPDRRKATRDAAWKRLRDDPERYAKFLAQGRESYARYAEREMARTNRWRHDHPDAWANIQRRRRERILLASPADAVLADAYADVIRREPCVYCGGASGEIDHITPLVDGGGGDWDNLAPACRSCNAAKHAHLLLQFLFRGIGAPAAA